MAWNEDTIRQKIQEFDADLGWYQNIDLGNGIQTKSRKTWGEEIDHPKTRWEAILPGVPEDMTGMSVLDLGCNAGFIALEAKKRGADYVCGVDYKQGYIDQANFCAEVLDLEVDFRVLEIENLLELGRTFDFVFFVGALYHCRFITEALDAVASVARKSLLCESAIYPHGNDKPLVLFVGDDPKLPGHWHPNMNAMAAMFRVRGFSESQVLFTNGGRGALLAERTTPL